MAEPWAKFVPNYELLWCSFSPIESIPLSGRTVVSVTCILQPQPYNFLAKMSHFRQFNWGCSSPYPPDFLMFILPAGEKYLSLWYQMVIIWFIFLYETEVEMDLIQLWIWAGKDPRRTKLCGNNGLEISEFLIPVFGLATSTLLLVSQIRNSVTYIWGVEVGSLNLKTA